MSVCSSAGWVHVAAMASQGGVSEIPRWREVLKGRRKYEYESDDARVLLRTVCISAPRGQMITVAWSFDSLIPWRTTKFRMPAVLNFSQSTPKLSSIKLGIQISVNRAVCV